MEKIKILFQHMTMIMAGVVAAVSIEAIVYYFIFGREVTFKWHMPVSILLIGIVGALPSLLLFTENELPKKKYHFRIVCHCILIYILTISVGHIFDWYDDLGEFLFVSFDFFLVYGFVWFGTMWLGIDDERQINEAIKSIQDDE